MAAMSRRRIYLPVALCFLVSLLEVSWAQDEDEDMPDMPDDMDGDYGGMGGMDEDGDMGGGGGGGGDDIPGVLTLDTHTFDKVVGLPSRTTLVKFDATFPSSENQDVLRELAQMASGSPDFFLAECKFEDGDDNDDNKDLKKRFGFATEDYPKYMFFKGPQDNITYDGIIDADNIARWVRQQGTKLRRVGLIPALDDAVHKFMKSGAGSEAEISNAKAVIDKDHKEDASAQQYLKIMTKIKEKGHDYIDKEFNRVSKVLQGQIAEQKRTELQDKKKILSVFASSRDEL